MLRKAVFGVVAVSGLWGCSKPQPFYGRGAGSLATSQDGALIYAVDTDNGALEIARAEDGAKVGEVKVGASPSRVVVGPDDRIYVSNRGERSVSVIDRASLKELQRVAVDVEPTGLSLTPDGKQLLVVSATDVDDPQHGTLTAFDTKTLARSWKTQVGEEPRGVAVVGTKAYVSNLKQGRLTVVNLETHATANSVDLNNGDSPDILVNPQARSAGAVTDVTPSPDGTRVYAPHSWQLAGSIGQAGAPEATGGSYGAPSTSCSPAGSIVSAGVATVVVDKDVHKVDSFDCSVDSSADAKDFPPSAIPASADGTAIQGPSAALVDPTGLWLFVANRNSNNVVVIPTQKRDATKQPISINVGAAPDGLALSKDGTTLYVYSQFDHQLSVIKGTSGDPTRLSVVNTVSLTSDTLPREQVLGRKMFFTAVDERLTAKTIGIACASCHLEGREDGHVWQFPDGPRQTPSLAGRQLEATAPYHWAGLFPTVDDFYKETVKSRMGGNGLSVDESANVTQFIEHMAVPENPLQGRADLAPSQLRGKAAFQRAGCEVCHAGGAMTDNQNHDVRTLTDADRLEALNSDGLADTSQPFPPLRKVNTPSLLGLGRTAPYLHDGSLLSVQARINQARSPHHDGVDHGDTSMLSDAEIADLESYLLAL